MQGPLYPFPGISPTVHDAAWTAPGAAAIGDDVTAGHMAILHGCTLKNRAFLGMGAIVLAGAVIEEGDMLAAGSVLPPGELWAAAPAQFMRRLDRPGDRFFEHTAPHYAGLAAEYRREYRTLALSCAAE